MASTTEQFLGWLQTKLQAADEGKPRARGVTDVLKAPKFPSLESSREDAQPELPPLTGLEGGLGPDTAFDALHEG